MKRSSALGWLLAALAIAAVYAICYLPRHSKRSTVATGAHVGSLGAAKPSFAAADDTIRVRGSVLVAGAGPLDSAHVCATQALAAGAPSCVKTDGHGAYVMEALEPGLYTLTAEAPGFIAASAFGGESFALRSGQQLSGVDVVLKAGTPTLSGSVSDALGGEVPFARLHVTHFSPSHTQLSTADARGHFAMAVAEGIYHVTASADGYAPASLTVNTPRADIRLILLPAASISGRVRTREGALIAGMQVRAQNQLGSEATARSDPEGNFTIDGLPAGTYRISAQGSSHFGELPHPVSLALAQTLTKLDVIVSASAVLRGRVTIRETGEPCAAGGVGLLDAPSPDDPPLALLSPPVPSQVLPRSAAIDGDGWVEIHGARPGRYYASVRCLDHNYASGPRVIDVDAALLAPNAEPLRWEVTRGADVTIRLVDALGKPAPWGVVWLLAPRPSSPSGERAAFSYPTDGLGVAQARGLAPGDYLLSSTDKLLADPVPFTVRPGDRALSVELRLRGRSHLLVRARGPRAEPVGDLDVSVTPVEVDGAVRGNAQHAVVAGPGEYRVGPLVAGMYRVQAEDGVNIALEPARGLVQVREGQDADLELAVPANDATLRGRVIGSDGEPVANAWVSISAEGASGGLVVGELQAGAGRALSDSEGNFTATGLRPRDSYVVTATHEGDADAVQRGVKPGTPVALRLGATGSISGIVVDESGAPASVLAVAARASDGSSPRIARMLGPGQFAIDDVAAGHVSLSAVAPDGFAEEMLTLRQHEHLSSARLVLRKHPAAKDVPPLAPTP